jgi:aspartyl-tRNA(Asn)/glutamyl-tRNA(Gln) amidotransferase subunit A
MAIDPGLLTVAALSRLIARRELSPREVVEAYLGRVSALDPLLDAYVTVMADEARAAAASAEAEIMRGRHRGPLHGVPFAVKDIIDVAGVVTTAGSRVRAGAIARRDATCVAHLRAAGAILLGKTITYEMATGGPSFDLPWPPARNPWHLDHTTGGSSSGSAAAVAGGLATFALGSDTGGSIRVPASFCGLAGLKPSFGLVSTKGVVPLCPAFDTVGPICRTAEDCACVLQALVAPEANDRTVAIAGPERDLAGVRIGLVRRFQEDGRATDAVTGAIEQALGTFRSLGATIEDVRLSPLEDYGACSRILVLADAFALHERNLIDRLDSFGEVFRYRVLPGALVCEADYVAANRLRRRLTEEMLAAVGRVDVLMTATTAGPAPSFETLTLEGRLSPFPTAPFSLSGVPAVSICNGFDRQGLPLGMQIAGRPFDETTVLRVAHAYQMATDWHDRTPPLDPAAERPTSRCPDWQPVAAAMNQDEQQELAACVRLRAIALSQQQALQLAEAVAPVRAMAARVRAALSPSDGRSRRGLS